MMNKCLLGIVFAGAVGLALDVSALDNRFCAGRVYLPMASLDEQNKYAVMLEQKGEEFHLMEAPQVVPQNRADYLSWSGGATYNNGDLQITNILVSLNDKTESYNATLSLLQDSTPLALQIKNASPNSINVETEGNSACVAAFNKPQAVLIEGRYHVRYELFLQDINTEKYSVSNIQVWDDDILLVEYTQDQLAEMIYHHHESQSAYAFITVISDTKQNRISLTSLADEQKLVRTKNIAINQSSPLLIKSPVEQGVWYFGETGPVDHHAFYVDFEHTLPLNSQRWAVDLLKISLIEENFCSGDCSRNEQFFSYGENFLAVADGTIVALNDGVADNQPGQIPTPDSGIEAGGNYVVLDLGDGIYAVYGHAISGSFQVNVGDRVTQGQVLGKIGNSGNSNAPHLHFHLARGFDIAEQANAEGVPFVLEKFDVIAERPLLFLGERIEEMPADDAVINID